MLKLEDWMDIKGLQREGRSVEAIARLAGFSRKTVRRVLRESAPKPLPKPVRGSAL